MGELISRKSLNSLWIILITLGIVIGISQGAEQAGKCVGVPVIILVVLTVATNEQKSKSLEVEEKRKGTHWWLVAALVLVSIFVALQATGINYNVTGNSQSAQITFVASLIVCAIGSWYIYSNETTGRGLRLW